MTKNQYVQKLKDPRWQKKRLEVMQANDFCCEMCGDSESPLNVHHKEYFKGYEPWDYEINQLAVICENCHETLHDSFDILKWVCSLANLDGKNNRDELSLVLAGYMGIDYQGMLTISGMGDCKAFRRYYMAGVRGKEAEHEMV